MRFIHFFIVPIGTAFITSVIIGSAGAQDLGRTSDEATTTITSYSTVTEYTTINLDAMTKTTDVSSSTTALGNLVENITTAEFVGKALGSNNLANDGGTNTSAAVVTVTPTTNALPPGTFTDTNGVVFTPETTIVQQGDRTGTKVVSASALESITVVPTFEPATSTPIVTSTVTSESASFGSTTTNTVTFGDNSASSSSVASLPSSEIPASSSNIVITASDISTSIARATFTTSFEPAPTEVTSDVGSAVSTTSTSTIVSIVSSLETANKVDPNKLTSMTVSLLPIATNIDLNTTTMHVTSTISVPVNTTVMVTVPSSSASIVDGIPVTTTGSISSVVTDPVSASVASQMGVLAAFTSSAHLSLSGWLNMDTIVLPPTTTTNIDVPPSVNLPPATEHATVTRSTSRILSPTFHPSTVSVPTISASITGTFLNAGALPKHASVLVVVAGALAIPFV